MLSQEQKVFILYTKGYFSKYVTPEKVIVGQALMMYPKDVSDQNVLNFTINLFDKLMGMDAIEGVGTDKYSWLINEMREIGNHLKAPTLYEWLYTKIQWADCSNISLDIDLETVKNKMQLV